MGFAASAAVWALGGGVVGGWFLRSWATAALYAALTSATFACATRCRGGVDLLDLRAHAPPPAKQRQN